MIKHFLIYAAYVIALAILIVSLPFIFRSPKISAPSPKKPQTSTSKKVATQSNNSGSSNFSTNSSSSTLVNTGPGSTVTVFLLGVTGGTAIFSYLRKKAPQ